MKRKQLIFLQRWLARTNRKPLVLRGARQVGKSTVVRLFAAEQCLDLAEVNLELHRDLEGVFASMDISLIIRNLESIVGKSFGPATILFLDEIQATPSAIAALRYFYEQRPQLAVVAAGSLLEFTLSNHGFSMPVGRIEYFHMGPMTFSEYAEAMDPHVHGELQRFTMSAPPTIKAHQKLTLLQREFMLTGGMPEAVEALRATGDWAEVTSVQRSISSTYQDDFAKYAKREQLVGLQRVFQSIPRVIGDKIKYANLLPDARAADVRSLLDLLEKARVFIPVRRTDCGGLPLASGVDPKFSKPLFMDVGLVAHILGVRRNDLDHLDERVLINEGPLAEQYIGQHLARQRSGQPELFYWARESRKSNAELDFVIQHGMQMVPIEVKAGKSGRLRSLHGFMQDKQLPLAVRFDLNPPSIMTIETSVPTASGPQSVTYRLLSLPLYAVDRLSELLDELMN